MSRPHEKMLAVHPGLPDHGKLMAQNSVPSRQQLAGIGHQKEMLFCLPFPWPQEKLSLVHHGRHFHRKLLLRDYQKKELLTFFADFFYYLFFANY